MLFEGVVVHITVLLNALRVGSSLKSFIISNTYMCRKVEGAKTHTHPNQ